MYTPPFSVSPTIVNLIAEISTHLGRLGNDNEGAESVLLRKVNRLKTIHSSLAIEGNNLTVNEVADIINGKNVIAPLREIQEVKNAVKVYDAFSSFDAFSEKDLLAAHRMMMEALVDSPGRYRTGGVGVYGESGLVHVAPPPHLVPTLMADLFEWLRTSDDHLLIRSCVFHYEFEFIHPFTDGNGRLGRLWQSLILSRLHKGFSHLPVENMVHASQQSYYTAIAESSAKADSSPFIEFMLGEILKALNALEVPRKVPRKVPGKNELKVLSLIKSKPSITREELAGKTGLSDGGIKKLLGRMKTAGWIVRRGSDKSGYWEVLLDIEKTK